jgi:hypothetical protein
MIWDPYVHSFLVLGYIFSMGIMRIEFFQSKGVVGQQYQPQRIEIDAHFLRNNCAYVLIIKLLI